MASSMLTEGHIKTLRAIRIFLLSSFVVVLIATLVECHPITHYWQVIPDPGPQCRQGYAQLLTMGITDIISDGLLIIFPWVLVFRSSFPWKRKISLVLLFGMSILLMAMTAYRMPAIIEHHSIQQYRSVWASGEILIATGVSNAVVLGSFLRDRGVKKPKYKPRYNSATESSKAPSSRRQTLTHLQAGSDEDLFSDVCYRLESDADLEEARPRLAQALPPLLETDMSPLKGQSNWPLPDSAILDSNRSSEEYDDIRDQVLMDPMPSPRDTRGTRERRVSFFDVGGLLGDNDVPNSPPPVSPTSVIGGSEFGSPVRTRQTIGGILSPIFTGKKSNPDLNGGNSPPMRSPASSRFADPPARGILRNVESNPTPRDVSRLASPPTSHTDAVELQDIGGLLPPTDAGDELQDVGGLLRPPPRERIDSRISPSVSQTPEPTETLERPVSPESEEPSEALASPESPKFFDPPEYPESYDYPPLPDSSSETPRSQLSQASKPMTVSPSPSPRKQSPRASNPSSSPPRP